MTVPHELSAFFESYRDAFTNNDRNAVAEHYHYPAHILGQADAPRMVALGCAAEMVEVLDNVLNGYQALGFVAAKIVSSSVHALSPEIARVDLVWALLGENEAELLTFDTHYTVALMNETWGITSVVSPNEVARMQSLTKTE